jgi:hypothetical protein
MLNKLCTRVNQDDVTRNWLIDTPDALNDADDHSYGHSVPFQHSKILHEQERSLMSVSH